MRKTVVRSGLGINAFFVLLRINQALVKGREVEKETLGGEGGKKVEGTENNESPLPTQKHNNENKQGSLEGK